MKQKQKRRRQTKTFVVKDYLMKEMAEQRIPLGGQLPTENDLMERFFVSRTTVRQAMSELFFDGLVDRQQGRGTFRVLPAERARRKERTMLVGMWFCLPPGSLYGPLADGIRDELGHWDYHAVLEGGLENGDERRGVQALIHKDLDGFIVWPSSDPKESHNALGRIIERGIPLVLLDKKLPEYQTDLVSTNSDLGAEALVCHLVKLGHRRIGFIGTSGVSTVGERLLSYRRTMLRHCLQIDEVCVQVTEWVHRDDGRQAAREILALPPDHRPTALFAASESIAETIAKVAREQGLQVPVDLSVVCFDDAAYHPEDRGWLTVYAQPGFLIGQQAARLLMKRIETPTSGTESILLEGKLVVRDSTAPACNKPLRTLESGDNEGTGTRPAPQATEVDLTASPNREPKQAQRI